MILNTTNTTMGPEDALRRIGKGSFEKKQRGDCKQLIANLIQKRIF